VLKSNCTYEMSRRIRKKVSVFDLDIRVTASQLSQ
jgi:hypothetical protein